MNHRRLIGSIVALALLAGSTPVVPSRAACAAPKAKATCPSCVPAPSTESAAISSDRSCCVESSSFAQREPARVAPDRSGEQRVLGVAVVVPAARVLIALSPPRSHFAERPGASPPLLRTTILLI